MTQAFRHVIFGPNTSWDLLLYPVIISRDPLTISVHLSNKGLAYEYKRHQTMSANMINLYPSDDDDFPIGAIIGIAIAGAIILLILVVLLICCIAYCVRSRRNYDKKLDSAYREFMRPYTTPYDSQSITFTIGV